MRDWVKRCSTGINDRAHIIETGTNSCRFRRTFDKRRGRPPAVEPSSAPPAADKKPKITMWSTLVTLFAQGTCSRASSNARHVKTRRLRS